MLGRIKVNDSLYNFILLNTCCIKFTYNNYVNKDNNIFYIIILWKAVFKTVNIRGKIG